MTGLDMSFLVAVVVGVSAVAITAIFIRCLYVRTRSLILTISPERRTILILGFSVAPVIVGTAVAILTWVSTFDAVIDFIAHHCHAANSVSFCLPHVQLPLPPHLEMPMILVLAGLVFAAVVAMLGRAAAWERVKVSLCAISRTCRDLSVRIIDDERPLAVCAGIMRPTVFVSKGLISRLNAAELKIVLAHEHAHARRRDGLQQLLALYLSIGHLSSIRRLILNDLVLASEQACDEDAARRTSGRIDVAQAIVKVERLLQDTPRGNHLSGVVALMGSSVPARIEFLLDEPGPRVRAIALHLAVSAIFFVLFLLIGAEPLHHFIESTLPSLMAK